MQKVRIVSTGGTGLGTTVTMGNGEEIQNIARIRIAPIMPSEIIRAELTIIMSELDITAHAILSLESVNHAARLHGYKLIPIKGE